MTHEKSHSVRVTEPGCSIAKPGLFTAALALLPCLGLPGLANKNAGRPVTFEFQINKSIFRITMSHAVFGTFLHQKSYSLLIWASLVVFSGPSCP